MLVENAVYGDDAWLIAGAGEVRNDYGKPVEIEETVGTSCSTDPHTGELDLHPTPYTQTESRPAWHV